MSYGGQQEQYGQEEQYTEEAQYNDNEQYGEEDQETGQQQQQQPPKPKGPPGKGAPGKGPQKGGAKGHRFPDPDIAAEYYNRATAAGGTGGQDESYGAMSNHTEDFSAQYSEEYDEQGNMQMQHHGGKGGRPIGGNYEDDQHHHAVMAGMEGLYNQGWTEEHKKSAAHLGGFFLGYVGKWAGFY